MKWLKYYVIFTIILLFSCDREKEIVPAYVHIKSFTLNTTLVTQGNNSSNIIGASVFANGNPLGIYELPVTIPVLEKGTVEISLQPIIKENGSAQNNFYYRPYSEYSTTLQLEDLKIDTIAPITTYRNNLTMAWIEDFEDQASSLEKTQVSNTNDSLLIIPTNTAGVDAPFGNSNYTGYISLAPSNSETYFELSSLSDYLVPKYGADVYLEMDIKSNANLQVGIYADNGVSIIPSDVLLIYGNNTWKKMYINLKSETSDLSSNTKIKPYFFIHKSAEDSLFQPKIYIDNLKLLYFE